MAIPGTRSGAKIISFTGDLGSGKSTVGKILTDRWQTKFYYTGMAFRDIAAKRGISVLELNQLAEKDPSIDHEVDSIYKDLAQTTDDLIVDARLAWHFLPQSFKIKLTVCPMVAAERIYRDKTRRSEKVDAPAQILASILARKASESVRYKALYGIDPENDANFDLIIDTGSVTPEDVAELIVRLSPMFFSGEHVEKHWICPKSLYPSERAEITGDGLVLPKDEFDHAPVLVIDYNRLYLIVDGHTRTSKALMAGVPFMPARTLRLSDDVPGKNLKGVDFYRANLDPVRINEWADIHGFHYIMLPDRP